MESPSYKLLVDLHRHFTFRPRRSRTFIFSAVLLDICLVLIGFVCLTAPFILKPGIRLELPQAPFADGVGLGAAVVTVPREGPVFCDDARVAPADLSQYFAELRARDQEIKLIIEADRSVDYGRLVNIYQQAMEAGIREVYMAVRISAMAEGEH